LSLSLIQAPVPAEAGDTCALGKEVFLRRRQIQRHPMHSMDAYATTSPSSAIGNIVGG
jgi:hypothetical protein